MENVSRFDKEAKDWDKNEERVKMASAIADAIMKNIHIDENISVADYGAGTGLISLKIAEKAKSVTAMDSSYGMIEVLGEKIENSGIKNVNTEIFDLQRADCRPLEKYDLLVCSMTLHHMENTAKAAGCFYKMIKKGGHIAVADLMPEDGSFHDDKSGTANFGFSEKQAKNIFIRAGFVSVTYEKIYEIEKNGKKYGIFLLIGEKSGSLLKTIIAITGHLFLALGLMAFLVPVIPSVPFLLLSAGCYLASNRRLYAWLINHKYMGPILRDFLDKKGLNVKVKAAVLFFAWVPALITSFVLLKETGHRLLMMILPVLITAYITAVPTKKD